MGVPKRKQSKRMQRCRRRAQTTRNAVTKLCPNCGAAQESHRVCPSCGHYRGRQVISVEVD